MHIPSPLSFLWSGFVEHFVAFLLHPSATPWLTSCFFFTASASQANEVQPGPTQDARTEQSQGKGVMLFSQPQFAIRITPAPSTEAGVIVLSMDGHVLHTDQRARDFAGLLTGEPQQIERHTGAVRLSHPLVDLFHDVLAELEKHIAAENWNQFEITCLTESADGMVLIRGFGIPDQARRQQ